jgi:GTP-binding protein EngB required for normal cell division
MMSGIGKEHQQVKDALLFALREMARLAGEVGMTSLATELEQARIPKLEEERFALVVLGEFNHGKSTFVNALCGAAILPAGITPTTATLNHLVYAERPSAIAYLDDDSQRKIDPERLGDWVTIEGKEAAHVRFVEVGWPAAILKDRVTLVDTPGVNDLNEARAEVTYGYIPRADAVLFLLDGTQVLKQSERSFLEQRILRRSKDKLIFILGKVDLLAPDEQVEALAFCREHLGKFVDEPVLFPVSAKRALDPDDSRRAASGFGPLLTYLQRYLARERGRVLLDNAVADGLRTSSYLRQNLGIKRHSLTLALDDLEARIKKVSEQLADARAHLRAHHTKIRAEADAIKAGVRLDIEGFTQNFLTRLPDQIDRADGNDVKRYLQSFIQDTWKAWAEAEGEKVAAQLERLAEEIIQVTNENVSEAMTALSRELGPADAQISMEVDTLKYDVGVFALGALGTGIFLFVNTLVGGLLTLATPLLAVVLKERLSSEIKGKKSAPQAIERAAEAIGPRFEQLVEEFQARLCEFVTAAGDALHRGIREVLDRALAERRSEGLGSEVKQREIDAQLARLRTIDDRLCVLREMLWESSIESIALPTNSET